MNYIAAAEKELRVYSVRVVRAMHGQVLESFSGQSPGWQVISLIITQLSIVRGALQNHHTTAFIQGAIIESAGIAA